MVCRSLPADLDGDPATQVGGADTRTCLLDRMLLMYNHLTMRRRYVLGDRNRMTFRMAYTRAQLQLETCQIFWSDPIKCCNQGY